MYYNPDTKEQISPSELRKLLNVSFPRDAEQVGDWHLLHNGTWPETDGFYRVVQGPIKVINDQYTQTYVLEELPLGDVRENLLSQFDTVMAENDRKAIRPILDGETELSQKVSTVQAQNRELRSQVVVAETVDALRGIQPVAVNFSKDE